MKCLTWTEFKSTCITKKSLSLQYEDLGTQYHIIGPDGNLMWEITLNKVLDDGSANPDVTDFETSYKTGANMPIDIRAGVGRPTRVSASPQPINTIQNFKGYKLTLGALQTSAYVDISFPSLVYVQGGQFYCNSIVADDYVNVDLLYGANDMVIISGLVSNCYLVPNTLIPFKSAESMALAPELKLRITLNGTAGLARTVYIIAEYFK